MKAKYMNLFTDYGFKKIFGEEASKLLLIDFLNALLPHELKITDLAFKNSEQLGTTYVDRKVIYDIYCENEGGEKFIVELQKAKQKYWTLFLTTMKMCQNKMRLFNVRKPNSRRRMITGNLYLQCFDIL